MKKRTTRSIIPSFFWTDFYKLTKGQLIFFFFRNIKVRFKLFNRGLHEYPIGMAAALRHQIHLLSKKKPEKEIIEWLSKLPFMFPGYLEWLGTYQFDPKEVKITQTGGKLSIVVEGYWYRVIYWEIPLMLLTSTLYYRMTGKQPKAGWREKAQAKGKAIYDAMIKVADFATRRAFSPYVHEEVLKILIVTAKEYLVGTSNVYLAYKYNLKPIGTMAHEFIMGMSALFGVRRANMKALYFWSKFYEGALGIALTDTYTTEIFLKFFGFAYAKVFAGDDGRIARHAIYELHLKISDFFQEQPLTKPA